MKDSALRIITHYGVRHQLKHFATEMYELNEAILDCENKKERGEDIYSDIRHIAEEIGDMRLMLNEFTKFYNIDNDEIRDVIKNKATRQLKRIEAELEKGDD